MPRIPIVVVGLILCCAGLARGQVTLASKLIEGSKYHLELETKLSQTLTLAGQDIETSSDSRSVTRVAVGRRDAATGRIVAEHQVESLQVTIGTEGMEYRFDSANPDDRGSSPLEIVRDIHKALAKRLTRITHDAQGRVEKVESEMVILGSVPEEVRALVKDQLDPEQLKRAANDEIDQIKSEPLQPGDAWQRTTTANFGSGQIMTFKTEFTYVGPWEKDGRTLEKISSKVIEVDFGLQNSPLPFTVKDSKLTAPESAGTVLFDRQRGQIVESTAKMRITGGMTFVVNNADLPATLDLKIESNQRVKP
jgi:hypothetical protein